MTITPDEKSQSWLWLHVVLWTCCRRMTATAACQKYVMSSGLLQDIAALILVAPAIVAPMFSRAGAPTSPQPRAQADVELDGAPEPPQHTRRC